MQDLLIAGVALIVALAALGRFLWPRLVRSVERGVELARNELAGQGTVRGEAKVTLAHVKPLSEEMVKEVASAEGYVFAGKAAGARSQTVLTFDRRSNITAVRKNDD